MSKMSQLHAELSEQAYDLGFESIGEAEQAGYGVDWQNAKLIGPQELAHQAWQTEKQELLKELNRLQEALYSYHEDGGKYTIPLLWFEQVGKAIKFIEEVKSE